MLLLLGDMVMRKAFVVAGLAVVALAAGLVFLWWRSLPLTPYVESRAELLAAVERLKDVKPVLLQSELGHNRGKNVWGVYFPTDEKTLRSVDHDGIFCLWDTATSRVRNRTILPSSYELLSVREPDGQFLACRDAAVKEK